MKKGVFGKVLTMIISLVTAVVALILIWSILEKVTGFSIGLLAGSFGKFLCENVPGGEQTVGAIKGGAIGGGGAAAAVGISAAACATGIGCPIGLAVGAALVAGSTIIGAIWGGTHSEGACS